MPPKRSASPAAAEPPPTKGEATRAALLAAAHKLFLQQGFHGTSMREIADEAGLAVGGIYNHFATKEAIFAAVLDAYHPYHTIVPALEETPGETVEDFIRNAAQRVREGMQASESKVLPLIFMELLEFQGRHAKQMAEVMLPQFMVFIRRFETFKGRVRALPLPILLRTFMSLVIGYFVTEMLWRGTKISKQFNLSADQWFNGLIDIYLRGILDERKAD